jgi:multiple sugar transport system substrate-binding protein
MLCKKTLKSLSVFITAVMMLFIFSACKKESPLDPANPVSITVWNYYSSTQKNAFDGLVNEFNRTAGKELGIIVQSESIGSIGALEEAVQSAADQVVGADPLPDLYMAYADFAYAINQRGLLVNIDDYISAKEQSKIVSAYLDEGRIGDSLVIYPIAKSTEVFMLNKTYFDRFTAATGITTDALGTIEGIAETAEAYYNWTDSLTPNLPDDGSGFFGRDAVANMMIIESKQLGEDIFEVTDGKAVINADTEVMRRIWDTYYIPMIKGYYVSYGRFASDDMKLGENISYIGSSSSASYFPTEITTETGVYPVQAEVLEFPIMRGGKRVMIQQGAGLAVTKSTPEREYAACEFLKWFTGLEENIRFSAKTAYMPVRLDAYDYDTYMDVIEKAGIKIDSITMDVLNVSFENFTDTVMFATAPFDGSAAARTVLQNTIRDKAIADRAEVELALAEGQSLDEATAPFTDRANFDNWLADLRIQLEAVVSQQ